MEKVEFVNILDREDLVFTENEHGQYIHTEEVDKCEDYANECLKQMQSKIDELEKELGCARKQNSYLRGSLNRLYASVSNGEHLDKDWIKGTLISEPYDRFREAANKKIDRLEKENKELVETLEFYASEKSWKDLV